MAFQSGSRRGATFEELLGKTLTKVEYSQDKYDKEQEAIHFYTEDVHYQQYHDQDCCESVTVEDICGDLDDLVGSPILLAEEVINEKQDNQTWTFYRISTIKGSVTIRWYGKSDGNYSERVSFVKMLRKEG